MGRDVLQPPAPNHNRRFPRFKLHPSFFIVALVVLNLQFYILPRDLSERSPSASKLSEFQLERLDAGLRTCTELNTPPVEYSFPVSSDRANPRWSWINGQSGTLILHNATLFDGERFTDGPVDIKFSNGVIRSISPSSSTSSEWADDIEVMDLDGKYVTPGLVDMHSHHLVGSWPGLDSTEDSNEVNDKFETLTPFVRSLDSMKPYDIATEIILSGGVTSSLILPGSANVMGGEGFMVKNVLRPGADAEEVVEELLLEHGIPTSERRRYMKMACGENPRRVYDHTRMGNAWIFRHHMERAKELREKQDAWCLSAAAARERGDADAISALVSPKASGEKGGLPEELELESSVAMLRGKIGINVHCYEPEDFEDMLLHSKEFEFRIQAFHHALEAWKVPEMIKASGENITIATFSEFGLYKKEAYEANLYAGHILAKHGVPVAYKSDHGEEQTNAKYLLFQAATAHSFGLPEDLALASVTSVPAKSLELDHRIGYVKPGFDADLVVWDSHPLLVGSTPLQVYVDGKAALKAEQVAKSLEKSTSSGDAVAKPKMRREPSLENRENICKQVANADRIFITGITKSFLNHPTPHDTAGNYTMVIEGGQITCIGAYAECFSPSSASLVVALENGHVLPGLTAVTSSLGLSEIDSEMSTGDGIVSQKVDALDPENIAYAKYGIHLEGRAFDRARIAGVTRAVTAPKTGWEETDGFLGGVSVGIRTSGKKTILDGGIFRDDVALHVGVGQQAMEADSIATVSTSIQKLRKILSENNGKTNIYGQVANGSFPLVVHVENKYDIMQLIKIKQDYNTTNLVVYGGSGAPHVAHELAAAGIPVILAANRGAPDTWEKLEALTGPPLTRSPADVLSEAGVDFGLAIAGSTSHIHNLALEAGWAGKYAGLSPRGAIDLVSRNLERILGLDESGDFVVFDGDPLAFGASVVLSIEGGVGAVECWPEAR